MIITVASYKGGVGKITTAIHLAAYFHRFAPTLLIDGDIIRALRLPVKSPKPHGKRSDPDWKQYSVLLKKESHKQASLLLRQKYEGIDISDLMQALLEQWLKTEQ